MGKTLIGIFFGSDTGNTEKIAKMIRMQLGEDISDIFDINSISSSEEIELYPNLLFGIPTWYYGELQCDWENFLPTLQKTSFIGKKIAIFGCGDQEDYSEYFCDAMHVLHNIVLKNGANVVGYWPTNGYYFESSKSVINNNKFIGLAIDEDRQSNLTKIRVQNWVRQIKSEMNIFRL